MSAGLAEEDQEEFHMGEMAQVVVEEDWVAVLAVQDLMWVEMLNLTVEPAEAEQERQNPAQGLADWPTLGQRPDILVSIGRTDLGTNKGALARLASGDWTFVDYLTQAAADQLYFQNSSFPLDRSLYLAGDKTFQKFEDSARAAFTGGDGIDIVAGDIRVDGTVSRVGHIHDDRYYTETETDALIETRVKRHRFPINDDGTYNVVPSYSNATRRVTLTPVPCSRGW